MRKDTVEKIFRWQKGFFGAVLAAALLAACGGGGGGDGTAVIPPFWSQSGVVAADFDGDGRLDVAVATRYIAGGPPHPGYVEIYLQSAPGHFDEAVRYATGPDPWGLSAGDVNGDGWLDLIAAIPSTEAPQVNVITTSGGVSLLRQDPNHPGHFLASQWFATGGAAEDAAIADLTGDGRGDLVVADGVKINGRALLLEQLDTLAGTFSAPTPIPVGAGLGSEDVAVADVNGDGRTDIVLASTQHVVVLYQLASGGFSAPVLLTAGLNPVGVAVADLDGDGRTDIVAANAGNAPAGGTGGASVTVFRQTSPGIFTATSVTVADGARRLAIDDLNGDGVPDIAVVSIVYQQINNPSRVTVLLQSGTTRGQFPGSTSYVGPLIASFIATGDMNGDGLKDIVLNDGPSVMLQRTAAPGTFDAVQDLRP
jgi:hypothetical protein